MVDVPHFAFPFTWGANGSARVVEQDSPEEVEQGVKVLMLTHVGERLEVPDFGIRDVTFDDELDLEPIARAATEWDERAAVVFEESRDDSYALIRNLLVQVSRRED